MFKFLLVLILISYGPYMVQGQNLAPNPSFENFTSCPTGWGTMSGPTQTSDVNDWFTASGGSTDYFNVCSAANDDGVPANFFGWQYAHTGDAYIGGYLLLADSGWFREYAQTKIVQPLIANHQYHISYWMSLAELNKTISYSLLAADKIGVYFSNTATYQANSSNLSNLTPQVTSAAGVFYSDTANWVKVQGTYTAQGGEEWMTIGNFSSPSNQNSQMVISLGPNGDIFKSAYYFLDDICLLDLSAIQNTVTHETFICGIGTPVIIAADTGMESYEWNTGAASRQITITQPGTYWVRTFKDCVASVDTFKVSLIANPPPLDLGNDTSICSNETLTLDAFHADFASYQWNTGATTASIDVNQTGRYIVKGISVCNDVVTDSIFINVKPQPVSLPDINVRFCPDDEGQIVLPAGFENVLWYIDTSLAGLPVQPPINTKQAGKHTFYLSQTVDGCESGRSVVQANVLTVPVVDIRDTMLCNEAAITLGSSIDDVQYLWNTGSEECCIQVNHSGVYKLKAFNECGADEKSATILMSECKECLWTPTAFSPNADGQNDAYEVQALCPFSTYQIKIFNRWGQLVFNANNVKQSWDGQYHGNSCDVGTYYFTIDLRLEGQNAPLIQKYGDITLIR